MHNFSWTHERTEVPRKPTNLKSKEGQVLPRRNEVREPAYQSRMCKDTGKYNSTKMYDKLLKVKCEIAREGKTPGNYRHKRSLHSFQLLLLVHKICIEKIGQMIWEIILVSRPGRVDQLWFREWQEVPLLSFSVQWDKHLPPSGEEEQTLILRALVKAHCS